MLQELLESNIVAMKTLANCIVIIKLSTLVAISMRIAAAWVDLWCTIVSAVVFLIIEFSKTYDVVYGFLFIVIVCLVVLNLIYTSLLRLVLLFLCGKMIGNFAVITVFPWAGHFCLSVIPSMAVIEAIISRLNNCVDISVAIGVLRILMVIRVAICVSKNVSVLTISLFLFQLWCVCCLFFKNQIRSVLPYKLVFARTIFRFPTQSC